MAASVKVSGGKAWEKPLTPYLEGKEDMLKVGVLEGATYPDGDLVAPIMAVIEFGAEVKKPERQTTLYFKQNKDGTVGNRFVRKDKSNFTQDATIGAHTFTIPARSPMRSTLAKKKGEWAQIVINALRSNPGQILVAFTALGEKAVKDIQQSFEDGLEPPLKDATIREKERLGYTAHASKAGIRTGATQESINYEVDI